MRHPLTRQTITIPMHGRDPSVGITHEIIKQAGLTPDEFRRLLG